MRAIENFAQVAHVNLDRVALALNSLNLFIGLSQSSSSLILGIRQNLAGLGIGRGDYGVGLLAGCKSGLLVDRDCSCLKGFCLKSGSVGASKGIGKLRVGVIQVFLGCGNGFLVLGQVFGLGLGSFVLWFNVVFLWLYTASCHSCRHIMGGRLTNFSKHPMRYKGWTFVSKLNGKHMQLAWTTLLTLVIADFYVMSVAAGWINDLRFYN